MTQKSTPIKSFKSSSPFTSPCLGTRITSVCSSSSTSTSSLTLVPFSTTFKAYFSTYDKRIKVENKCQRELEIQTFAVFCYLLITRKKTSSSRQNINIFNLFLSSAVSVDHTDEFYPYVHD